MFEVIEKQNGILRTVYSVKDNLFLIYKEETGLWIWAKNSKYTPFNTQYKQNEVKE